MNPDPKTTAPLKNMNPKKHCTGIDNQRARPRYRLMPARHHHTASAIHKSVKT